MTHRNSVQFEVFGDYALFSDPITRVSGEKYSYQIPTYEALKGIVSSVYWKPTFIWYIDRLRVMNPVRTMMREMRLFRYNTMSPDLACYMYLCKCRYQVEAHFEWNMNRPELESDRDENKHHNIAKRMILKGGRRDVFLGARECQGYVKPCVFGEGESFYDEIPEVQMGLMLHGITYPDEAFSEETKDKMTLRFWRPVMRNGIVEFIRPEACPSEWCKPVKEMKMKPFSFELRNFSGLREFNEVPV